MKNIKDQCINQLISNSQDFSKINFLKKLALLSQNEQTSKAAILIIYTYYCFIQKQNLVESLDLIQQFQREKSTINCSLIEENIMKLIKISLLTNVSKYKEAMEEIKPCINAFKKAYFKCNEDKQIFESLVPNIIQSLLVKKDKKQFLQFFEEILIDIQDKVELKECRLKLSQKILEIRSEGQCHGSIETKRYLNKKSLSSSNLNRQIHKAKQDNSIEKDRTSIYINKIYEERKQILMKREGTMKKTSHKLFVNPYELNLQENKKLSEKNECVFM